MGLSLSDLARRADTSGATLSRYENGWTRFETATLRKLAAALNCDLRIDLVPTPRGKGARRGGRQQAVKQIRRLFWDRPLTSRDFGRYPVWVTERVLDYGNLDDVRVLRETLGRERFMKTVAQASRVSPKTRALWELVLQKEGIPCTRRFSRPAVWNY